MIVMIISEVVVKSRDIVKPWNNNNLVLGYILRLGHFNILTLTLPYEFPVLHGVFVVM